MKETCDEDRFAPYFDRGVDTQLIGLGVRSIGTNIPYSARYHPACWSNTDTGPHLDCCYFNHGNKYCCNARHSYYGRKCCRDAMSILCEWLYTCGFYLPGFCDLRRGNHNASYLSYRRSGQWQEGISLPWHIINELQFEDLFGHIELFAFPSCITGLSLGRDYRNTRCDGHTSNTGFPDSDQYASGAHTDTD